MGCLLPLEVFMMPSCIMKASPQGEDIQESSGPGSEIHMMSSAIKKKILHFRSLVYNTIVCVSPRNICWHIDAVDVCSL